MELSSAGSVVTLVTKLVPESTETTLAQVPHPKFATYT